MLDWDDAHPPKSTDIPQLLAQLELSAPEDRWKFHYALVWAYFDANNYEKALEAYHACKDKVPDEKMTSLILKVADPLTEYGEIDEAVAITTKRLKELEKRGEKSSVGVANLHLSIGYSRWRQGSFDEAMDQCQMALAIFTSHPEIPKKELVLTLTTMGLILWEKGDYQMALKIFQQGKDEAIKAGLESRLMWISNNMGLVHYAMGEYDEALKLYDSAMVIAVANNEKNCQALLSVNTGLVYFDRGDLGTAEKFFLEGKKISEEIENFVSTAIAYTNIGTIAYERGDMEAARTAIDESFSLCRHMKEKWLLSVNRVNMARICLAKGDLKLARHNAEQALVLAKEMKAKESQAAALRELGHIEVREGMNDNARKYFEMALSIFEGMNSRYDLSKTLLMLGQFLTDVVGDKAAGRPMIERALSIAKTIGAKRIQTEAEAALEPKPQ